jgi:hypothetical protein
MKLSLDPSVFAPRNITAESLALAKWYDAHPDVQRLWGITDAQTLRVVVSIEPTHDSDDVYPTWVANGQTWARELHTLTGRAVELELVGESPLDGIEFRAESVIVADLFWRDATLIPPHIAV